MSNSQKTSRRAGRRTGAAWAAAVAALGISAVGASATAHADLVLSQTVPDTVPLSGDGLFQNGSATVGFTFNTGNSATSITDAPGSTGAPMQAGQFTMTLTNTVTNVSTNIQAYCGDIFDFLNQLPATVNMTQMAASTKTNILNALLTAGNTSVNNIKNAHNQGIASAALQLAIWEVMNETSGSFDVTSGNFAADSKTSKAVTDQANADIANVENGTWKAAANFNVEVLTDTNLAEHNQDIIFAMDPPPGIVPEPQTVAMFGISLFGLGFLRRRKIL